VSSRAPGSKEDGPFNAGDPEQVREREKKSKLREDARREGMKFVMSQRAGRAWMRHLLAEKLFTRVGKVRPAAIFTGNSTTFYNAALKELGDIVASELATLCPDEFRLMETEGEG
jgi:hypothetical protein